VAFGFFKYSISLNFVNIYITIRIKINIQFRAMVLLDLKGLQGTLGMLPPDDCNVPFTRIGSSTTNILISFGFILMKGSIQQKKKELLAVWQLADFR